MKSSLLGARVLTLEHEVEFWYRAGYDYLKLQPTANFDPTGSRGSENVLASADGTVVRTWASEAQGVIGTPADLDRYVFPDPGSFDYSRFEAVRSLLPEGMGVIGQYGDIFTMTWEMMGFEGFSYAIQEDPGLVQALNERVGELVLGMFRRFAASDSVDALWYSDDISYTAGLMVSPSVLERYFFPWLEKIGALAHAAGKPLIYHSDGILYDVMDRIIACGVDALHPIEPMAMDIAEVKRRYGDRLCLVGNVDVDLLSRGSPAEVREVVRRNIATAGVGGGYCVGSGNSIPDYVKPENYLAMLDAAAEFGTYEK
jgi:uroporphyrinogen decarboxylase